MNSPAVHSGVLYIQRLKALRQKWKRSFCAIFGSTSQGVARIEVYESEENFRQSRDAYNILLRDAVSVKQVPGDSRYSTVLQLVTSSQTYLFATDNDFNDLEAWIQLISEVAFSTNDHGLPETAADDGSDMNDEACYEAPWDIQDVQVTIIETDSSHHYGLFGSYDMTLSPDGIILKVESSVAKIWAYSDIERFGIGNDCFAMQTRHGQVFEFTSNHPFRLLEKIRSYVPLNLDINSPENRRMPVTLNYTDYFRALKPNYRETSMQHAGTPPDVPRFDRWEDPFDRNANERRSYPKMGARHLQNSSANSPVVQRREVMARSASQSDDPYSRGAPPNNQQLDIHRPENLGRNYDYGSRNTLKDNRYRDDWERQEQVSKSPKEKSRGFLDVLRRISTRKRKSPVYTESVRGEGSRNSGWFARSRPSAERQRQRDRIYPDYYPPNHGYYPPSDFSYDGSLPANYGRDRNSVFMNEAPNFENASLQVGPDYRQNQNQRSRVDRYSPSSQNFDDYSRKEPGGTVYYYPGSDTKYATDPRATDMTRGSQDISMRDRRTRSGDSKAVTASQYIPSRYELTQQLEQINPTSQSRQQDVKPRSTQGYGRIRPEMYAEDEDYDEIDDEGEAVKDMAKEFRTAMNIGETPARVGYERPFNRTAAHTPIESRSAPGSATSRISKDQPDQQQMRSIRRKESNQSLGRSTRPSNAPTNSGSYTSIKKIPAPVPPQRRLNAAARDRRSNRSTDV